MLYIGAASGGPYDGRRRRYVFDVSVSFVSDYTRAYSTVRVCLALLSDAFSDRLAVKSLVGFARVSSMGFLPS